MAGNSVCPLNLGLKVYFIIAEQKCKYRQKTLRFTTNLMGMTDYFM